MGKKITFAPFTSLTLSETVAEEFGDSRDAIYFVFTNAKGVRLGEMTAFEGEEEVLMEPPSVFKVVARSKFNRVLTVILERLDSPLKYLA